MNCLSPALLQHRSDMDALRERYASDFMGKNLKDVYFVTEQMAEFICQNVRIGTLWIEGRKDEFIQEITDHLFDKAHESTREEADNMRDSELEFIYTEI